MYILRPTTLVVCLGLIWQNQAVYAAENDVVKEKSSNKVYQAKIDLAPIEIEATKLVRDDEGKLLIFTDNLTSEYHGKKYIDRYKGANPADIFRGMVGVFSSDARNSGAVVPNIRGMQDFGRVPLTIDGMEQATVAYRGYAGVSTRSFIDPMLISGVRVIKGGSIHPNVKVGNAGGVVMTTLEAADIIQDGKNFGIDIMLEASNNTTRPNMPPELYGLTNKELIEQGYSPSPVTFGGSLTGAGSLIDPKQAKDNKFLRFKDHAFRLAAAYRGEQFDVLFAHAQRKKGNNFIGKNRIEFYRTPNLDNADQKVKQKYYDSQLVNYHRISNAFRPGSEAPNTSFNTRSELFKLSWRPTDEHLLKLGLRYTDAEYGDIMPSRLSEHALDGRRYDRDLYDMINGSNLAQWWDTPDGHPKLPQWPLSEVKTRAANLDYRYNPQHNNYVDLQFGVWGLQVKNHTMNSGGSVWGTYNPGIDPKTSCTNNWPLEDLMGCVLYNTAAVDNTELRKGISISNKLQLGDSLTLTPFADYQHEKVYHHDKLYDHKDKGGSGYAFVQEPRKGRRATYNLGMALNWSPTEWLDLDLAVTYSNGWSYNDRTDEKLAKGVETWIDPPSYVTGRFHSFREDKYKKQTFNPLPWHKDYWGPSRKSDILFKWYPRADGKYYKEDNVYLQYLQDPASQDFVILQPGESPLDYLGKKQIYIYDVKREPGIVSGADNTQGREIYTPAGEIIPVYEPPANVPQSYINTFERRGEGGFIFKEKEKRKKYHGWSGSIGAAVSISDVNRVYLRYSSILRIPSLFELTSGFGSNQEVNLNYAVNPLKAERTNHFEIGYIHDLKYWLKAKRFADVKISYYNDQTLNYIDRRRTLIMRNVDKHKMDGVELQTRYDNGRFFGDFSAAIQLNNQVCDQQRAWTIDPLTFKQQACVKNGWLNSQSRAAATPKYSLALHLGGRWWQERLEIGTRLTFHSKRPTDGYDQLNFEREKADVLGLMGYQPINWNNVLIIDAYANYRIKDNIYLELLGANLSNIYYLDPVARAHTPAPGRTIKLGLNIKF